jgi:RNA recognition motif-containing protein
VCRFRQIHVSLVAFVSSDQGDQTMELKLYVGNLSYSTTEDDLRTLFAQAGTVNSAELIKDRETGSSKGFGFVEMSNQSEAEKAISMFNGYSLGNRELKVNMARPREERAPGGFGNRGGGGGGGGGYGGGGGGYGGGGSRGGPGGGDRNRRGGSSGGTKRY